MCEISEGESGIVRPPARIEGQLPPRLFQEVRDHRSAIITHPEGSTNRSGTVTLNKMLIDISRNHMKHRWRYGGIWKEVSCQDTSWSRCRLADYSNIHPPCQRRLNQAFAWTFRETHIYENSRQPVYTGPHHNQISPLHTTPYRSRSSYPITITSQYDYKVIPTLEQKCLARVFKCLLTCLRKVRELYSEYREQDRIV